MTTQVTPMPGFGCKYYATGQCTREMEDDPLFHDKWRCRVVARWEDAFDTYLTQVDRFELSQDTAMRIWSRRFSKLSDRPSCPDFLPGDNPVVGCAFLHYDLCRLKLPSCPGRCKHYQPE